MRIGGKRLLLFLVFILLNISCRGTQPIDLGYENASLVACPNRPNCVSSQVAPAAEHYIKPFPRQNPSDQAIEQIAKIIQALPRTKIVEREPHYLLAEFESLLFRYVDDVEFYISDDPASIHVRSASRLGYSDLGANRRRIEDIRQRYLIRLESIRNADEDALKP
ncbi:MAG: DUF1499 domain-containing protein [Oligoflexus sp.]